MMNDIMLDLETMDNVMSSTVVSIGTVQCNIITGELGEKYYRVVDLEGQTDRGLTIDAGTVYWWLKQSHGARQALQAEGKISVDELCKTFTKWVNSLGNPQSFRLWGNGATFDNAILRYVYRKCREQFPIPFWNDRDMRTLVGFYPQVLQDEWKNNNRRVGTYHNPLDDAIYQVQYCSNILQELGVKELY